MILGKNIEPRFLGISSEVILGRLSQKIGQIREIFRSDLQSGANEGI